MTHHIVIIPEPVKLAESASVAALIMDIVYSTLERQRLVSVRLGGGEPLNLDTIEKSSPIYYWAERFLQFLSARHVKAYVWDEVRDRYYRLNPDALAQPPRGFHALESIASGTLKICEELFLAGSVEEKAANWPLRVPAQLGKQLLDSSVPQSTIDKICAEIVAEAVRKKKKVTKARLIELAQAKLPSASKSLILTWFASSEGAWKIKQGRLPAGSAL